MAASAPRSGPGIVASKISVAGFSTDIQYCHRVTGCPSLSRQRNWRIPGASPSRPEIAVRPPGRWRCCNVNSGACDRNGAERYSRGAITTASSPLWPPSRVHPTRPSLVVTTSRRASWASTVSATYGPTGKLGVMSVMLTPPAARAGAAGSDQTAAMTMPSACADTRVIAPRSRRARAPKRRRC